MRYYHVDVFSNKPFSGNGLTVFTETKNTDKSFMQILTQEMRQFESIFLHHLQGNEYRAFIFTMEEELDFAGHPVIGAAAVLHNNHSPENKQEDWVFQLNTKSVAIRTVNHNTYYSASMNQGKAAFLNILSKEQEILFLGYLNLGIDDRYDNLPFQVISTGLPYLILPVRESSLARVKVTIPNLEEKLLEIGAKFFYVLSVEGLQGRTWDNAGLAEDIATGSAAGPAGAYLVTNGLAKTDTAIILRQGDFLNRPSSMKVVVENNGDIIVEGDVCKIAAGELYDNNKPEGTSWLNQ